MNFDTTIWDAVVSPSGRYIALIGRDGITVSPMFASSVEQVRMGRDRASQLKRVTSDNVDYYAWAANDTLIWSVQNRLYTASADFTHNSMVEVKLPAQPMEVAAKRAYLGGRIITMTEAGVIENGLILTNGSKIEYVGPSRSAVVPPGYEVVDTVGKTVIPGLIDVHRHWDVYNSANYDVTADAPYHHLFVNAAYGVTTVYDPQISTVEASYISELSSSDDYNGSTFYASGYAHHGDSGHTINSRVNSYDDALRLVGRMSLFRSAAIKDYLQPSRTERRWLADAARHYGLGIVAHERNDLRTHMTLVVDGFSGLEHEMLMGDDRFHGDVRRLLVESGVSITPTLGDSAGANPFRLGHVAGMTKQDQRFKCLAGNEVKKDISDWEAVVAQGGPFGTQQQDWSVMEYSKLLREGAMVTIGAHDLTQGVGTHWEMWILALGGAPPIDVLRAATVNGATKLNIQDRVGSLAEGMDADFVVLNSNPLDSIYNTTDISRVIRRGHALRWPDAGGWPKTWPANGDWASCKAWYLGESGGDSTSAQSTQ